MGNEALRASRSSTSFRRSSRSRRSQKASSGGGQQYIAEDEVDPAATAAAASDLTPKPTRRMDKIRRSLSFRRKKKSSSEYNIQSGSQTVGKAGSSSAAAAIKKSNSETQAVAGTTANGGTAVTSAGTTSTTNANVAGSGGVNGDAQVTRPHLWIEDEKKVRSGNCSFQVKYLGFQEVSDSRGMHICEQALEKLISADRKKPIKAILYVSGDSLRVVDESNKTLLVDQTIEKVSFCAPDRHHDAGFAYICRDGTSRRWLCHGFLAAKDTLKQATLGATGGERLSHAVGCAFSVCLEKKQKRERENVSMEHGPMHSFARLGSFRQASLTERFDDPQAVMPKIDPVPIRTVENPHAIERPKPSNDAFRRGEAGRGTMLMQPGGAAFNRRNQAAYASLKPGELPSFQQQREKSGFNAANSNANTPSSSLAETKTALLAGTKQTQQQQQPQQQYQNMTLAQLANGLDHSPNSISKSDTFNKLNTISAIPEESLIESSPPPQVSVNQAVQSSSSIPALASPLQPLQPTPVLQPTPTPPPRPPSSTAAQQQSDSLSNQLMATHLNVDPPPEWSQPAVSVATIENTTNVSNVFAQPALTTQYFTTPTIFATPQSITTGTPMLVNQSVPNTTPLLPSSVAPTIPIYQPIYTTNQVSYLTSPSSSSLGTTTTPGANVLIPSLMTTPTTVSSTQETFEQKWARYQAAKKQTNPFAEDIAKKYEIKL